MINEVSGTVRLQNYILKQNCHLMKKLAINIMMIELLPSSIKPGTLVRGKANVII